MEPTATASGFDDSQTEKGPSGRHEEQHNFRQHGSPRQIYGIKWAIAYAAMLSTTFLFALDNTIASLSFQLLHCIELTSIYFADS